MNYSNVIICPVGDQYGTAKSHLHGWLQGYHFGSEEEEENYQTDSLCYKEVSPEIWAMWALNAKSAYVSGATGSFGNHNLWRSELPSHEVSIYGRRSQVKNTAGTEAPATVLSDATEPALYPKVKGLLPFISLPWILGGSFVEAGASPPPVNGPQTPFFNPAYYILDGKFYIAENGITRLEVGMNSMTAYWESSGIEYSINTRILTTFY